MVNPYRIKEYVFPAVQMTDSTYSAAGSKATLYTSHPVNGEVLKVKITTNFTGSIILGVSGAMTSDFWTNFSVTSGTGKNNSASLTNTTGSYAVNDILSLVVSGALSGTNTIIGPISLLYR